MNNVERLIDIADYLGLTNVVSELNSIDLRSKQENANLILPLVGEFSSGKTTLINALTDCRKLETATKPTTSTIYEIHFGCETCHAKVVTEEGQIQDVDDIANLKNDDLANAKVVTVFDTSKRVPSTTILVDTPGLSSPDPKHKQTLVSFLPKADGILLVTDINQQITRSLTDFIETMKLSKRPIFLILTKSDTKSAVDIESAKKYISENCQIPLKQLAVVSAATNNLEEIYSLLDSIQKDKKEILKQVDSQRIKNIVNLLTKHVETLMNASSSDKDLDEAIRMSQHELDKISRNIDRLVDSLSDDIEEQERTISRKFEDAIFARLSTLVAGKSNNFDGEAISSINNTATLLMNDYKIEIQNILREKARSQKGSENEVPFTSLENIDLSSIQMSGLSYNLDLNSMGHEYDGWIKTGVIAVAAIGAVAAVASTGGAAAGTLTTAATVDNVIDVADTVTDVGSMISNQKNVGRMERAVGFVTSATDKYNSFNESNQQMGQQVGSDKGMIDSLVGLVTDEIMSKPQRVRAIRNYVDGSLAPEFKSSLQSISQSLVNSIRCNLQHEASVIIGQKTDSLNQLRNEMKEKKDLFEQRKEQLREFKTILLTI
ncbi:MAG: dynamin family protein [Bacteroidales bacterium]|nr:dynamin family protein [Bacteroidales bacterium]